MAENILLVGLVIAFGAAATRVASIGTERGAGWWLLTCAAGLAQILLMPRGPFGSGELSGFGLSTLELVKASSMFLGARAFVEESDRRLPPAWLALGVVVWGVGVAVGSAVDPLAGVVVVSPLAAALFIGAARHFASLEGEETRVARLGAATGCGLIAASILASPGYYYGFHVVLLGSYVFGAGLSAVSVTWLVVARARARLRAQRALAEKLDAVSRLAGGVAHDFNGHLTSILGYTDLLLRTEPSSDRLDDALRQIRGSALDAAVLARKLLAFGGRDAVAPVRVELREALEGMRGALEAQAGASCTLEIDAAPCELVIDPVQLEQMLRCLVANARDASPPGGRIQVSARPDAGGAEVALAVRDWGEGIAADVRPLVFDPFFTTRGHAASGLGLSTVHGIAKQAKGRVELDAPADGGTRVVLHLPAAPGASAVSAASRAEMCEEPEAGADVLVVEDDEVIRRYVCQVLERADHRCRPAASLDEALEAADAGPIDVCLIDLLLGSASGLEVADAVARVHPDARVVFMTGHADPVVLDAIPDRGRLLRKPFTMVELVVAVEGALAEGRPDARQRADDPAPGVSAVGR